MKPCLKCGRSESYCECIAQFIPPKIREYQTGKYKSPAEKSVETSKYNQIIEPLLLR